MENNRAQQLLLCVCRCQFKHRAMVNIIRLCFFFSSLSRRAPLIHLIVRQTSGGGGFYLNNIEGCLWWGWARRARRHEFIFICSARQTEQSPSACNEFDILLRRFWFIDLAVNEKRNTIASEYNVAHVAVSKDCVKDHLNALLSRNTCVCNKSIGIQMECRAVTTN